MSTYQQIVFAFIPHERRSFYLTTSILDYFSVKAKLMYSQSRDLSPQVIFNIYDPLTPTVLSAACSLLTWLHYTLLALNVLGG